MSLSFWIFLAIYIVSIVVIRFTPLWKKRVLEPMAMTSMIAGIVFLCQPWVAGAFRFGLGILIFGLIWWNIAVNMKIKKEEA